MIKWCNIIQSSPYIQVDESPIKVLESEQQKQSHQGYQWIYHSPLHQTVAFNYRKGRGMHGPKEFLENYQGYLQCDGYKVYDKIAQAEGIILVGCIAHARRYFYEALDNDQQRANFVLQIFKDIYTLEKTWKSETNQICFENRQKHIKPKFEELKAWCEQQALTAVPSSKIGKAFHIF